MTICQNFRKYRQLSLQSFRVRFHGRHFVPVSRKEQTKHRCPDRTHSCSLRMSSGEVEATYACAMMAAHRGIIGKIFKAFFAFIIDGFLCKYEMAATNGKD